MVSEGTAGTAGEPSAPLDATYAEALALYLECGSIPEVAEKMGHRRHVVWRWFQRPEVRAKLLEKQEELLAEAASKMKRLSSEAVDTLAKVMRGDEQDQARMAAVAILDRAGLGATQKHEVDVGRRADQLSPERIRELEEAARADLARGALVEPGGDGDDEG